jgi:diguanylate cyclase (GGDEF)-like protein
VLVVLVGLVFVSIAALGLAAMGQRASLRVQHQLRHIATHDSLTGLRNRVALTNALSEVLAARSPSGRAAVLLIELDRFSAINDTYGHDVGDQLMVAAARQIERSLHPNETIYRLGGPQFVVLAPSATTRDAAQARAQQLQESVRVQYRIDHDHLRITATVAVVLLDQRHTSPDVVLEDADAAVREATRRGPGSTVVFEVSMRAKVSAFDAEARLRQALERDEFLLMYLPVVTLDDSRIVGVEALLRWADPERGVVAPGEFLSLLELTDLLEPVGDWVVAEACRHNKRWQEIFPGADIATTINVSPRQLEADDFTYRIDRIVQDTGADPARLCFEITEGAARTDIENVWRNLRQLKELGMQLALDDFGTGNSTFDYIRKFQLDILKVDRVFVDRVNKSDGDYAIVQQIISMAHSLDFVTIAEGVDNADQATTLATLNCDLGQGYYWSQPQSLDTIEKLIGQGTIRPSANRAKKIDWKAPAKPKS